MNINDYREKYAELEQNIEKAQKAFQIFKISAKSGFNELYLEEKKRHLNWFSEHFDYFQKHKEYIKRSQILSKIVIDFMPLYIGGGLLSGVGISINPSGYKIFLGDLLDLWDSGFCYEGHPIVFCELGIHWTTTYIIKYIKNKNVETVQKEYDGRQWYIPEIGEEIFKCMKKANISRKFPDMSIYRTIELIMKYNESDNECQRCDKK